MSCCCDEVHHALGVVTYVNNVMQYMMWYMMLYMMQCMMLYMMQYMMYYVMQYMMCVRCRLTWSMEHE